MNKYKVFAFLWFVVAATSFLFKEDSISAFAMILSTIWTAAAFIVEDIK